MKKVFFIFALLAIALTACPQKADQTFEVPVTFKAGFYFGDGTFMSTVPTGTGGAVYWDNILAKPTLFPPQAHTHPSLYRPIEWTPTWDDVRLKPLEIELKDALSELEYLPITQKTTAQINATQVPFGVVGMIWDNDLGVLKIWDGQSWKIIITNK